jgi:hypothetical protein
MGHGGFKVQVQQRIIQTSQNKERFPLSHGTATAIYLNMFTNFVALGL